MKVVDTERLPIHVWGEDADEATMRQARNLANLSFARRHIALLPDAHVGFGMPIGGVLAAAGAVVPHAVGLDIGCGVRAWRTNVAAADLGRVRDPILNDIQRSVPQGFEWHAASQADRTDVFDGMPEVPELLAEREKAARQLGTLGGGNHFIELQVDAAGVVWAMIHTGSRNVGKLMADRYDAIARAAAAHAGPDAAPLEWGLAHLATDSEAGVEYLEVMGWCLRFARENRRLIAEAVERAIARRFPDVVPDVPLDVHHNYAAVEEHFGESLVVHRKGAVRAKGRVIVPGSMGTASYIGEGMSAADSFESCSHGAGRAMGRKQAVRTIPRERVAAQLEQRGVRLFKVRKRDLAEEAPEAYKDIESVMLAQSDLVAPLVRLTPIGVVKG